MRCCRLLKVISAVAALTQLLSPVAARRLPAATAPLIMKRRPNAPVWGNGARHERAGDGGDFVGRTTFVSVATSRRPLQVPRGGACEDSDPTLFAKIAMGVAVETAALLGVLAAPSLFLKDFNLTKVWGLSIAQWASFLLVIFGSSLIGSVVDGSLSAASSQVLEPNALPGDPDWYINLNKPRWEPPGWVFPIMWLIVSKPTQLVAVAKLFRATAAMTTKGNDTVPWWPELTVYCLHLSLGDAWNKVFFGLQCPGRGAAVITVFLGVLLLGAALFAGVDRGAGLFLLPTSAWVTVATALNWYIYRNN